jgi:hypothetical protein
MFTDGDPTKAADDEATGGHLQDREVAGRKQVEREADQHVLLPARLDLGHLPCTRDEPTGSFWRRPASTTESFG